MAHTEAQQANLEEISVLSPADALKMVVRDVYFGNGPANPALTVRVAGLEEQQKVFKEAMNSIQDWQKNASKLLLGTMISALGGAVLLIIDLLRAHH